MGSVLVWSSDDVDRARVEAEIAEIERRHANTVTCSCGYDREVGQPCGEPCL